MEDCVDSERNAHSVLAAGLPVVALALCRASHPAQSSADDREVDGEGEDHDHVRGTAVPAIAVPGGKVVFVAVGVLEGSWGHVWIQKDGVHQGDEEEEEGGAHGNVPQVCGAPPCGRGVAHAVAVVVAASECHDDPLLPSAEVGVVVACVRAAGYQTPYW